MDKYEYRIRAEEINALIEKKEYVEAVKIADTIDWRRVRSVVMLCKVSELYKMNRRYEDSKEVLLLAYDLQPNSRKIVYSLCELSIKLEETVQAVEYYKEFIQIAPRDTGRFILQYRLYEAQDVSLEERIAVLEEYKKRDYREKWAYELAYLYHRIGLATRCVEECDELVLWFGEGRYVIKALELKMLHAPLTPEQQEKYNARFAPEEEVPAAENVTEVVSEEPSLPIEIKAVDPTRAKTEEIPVKQISKEAEELTEGTKEVPDIPYDVMTGYIRETEKSGETIPEEKADEEPETIEEIKENIPDETEETASEETVMEIPEEDEDMKIVNPAEDLDIHVKTIDVGDAYNTINLQEELAKNLAEILAQEDMGAADATKALPVDSIFQAANIAASIEKAKEDSPQSETSVEEITEVSAPETEEMTEAGIEKAAEIELEEPVKMDTSDIIAAAEKIKAEIMGTSLENEYEDGKVKESVAAETIAVTDLVAEAIEPKVPEEPVKMDTGDIVAVAEKIKSEIQETVFEDTKEETVEIPETEEIEEIEETTETIGAEETEETAEIIEAEDIEETTEIVEAEETEETAETIEAEKIEETTETAEVEPIFFNKNEALPEAFIQAVQNVAMEAAKEAAKQAAHATVEAMKETQPSEKETDENKEEVIPEQETQELQVEKQITGQLSFNDIMAEWEETKKANEEKHLQEMKQRVLEQTGPLFSDFDTAAKADDQTGLDMLSPMLDVFSDTAGLATEVENALVEEETTDIYEIPVEQAEPTEEISTLPEAELEIKLDTEITEDRPSSFNTEEINGLEDKLMYALGSQHYETANISLPIPIVKEKIETRFLTKEEKELFGSIAQTKELQEKVAYALDSISLVPTTGNVIVTGERGTGALEVAQNIAAYLSQVRKDFTGNAITYTGKDLAEINVVSVINEVVNGALIVENAGDLTANLCGKLIKAAEELDGRGVVFIFVDTKSDIDRLIRAYQKITEHFDVRIDITSLDNNGLVSFGKEYAKEKEYSIDDMGVLALYNRIEERQTNEHAVTVEEVKEIVNEAIIRAEKKNLTHFMDVIFSKRYDKDDMVVLREKDFMEE